MRQQTSFSAGWPALHPVAVALLLAAAPGVAAQTTGETLPGTPALPAATAPAATAATTAPSAPTSAETTAVPASIQPLLAFQPSDIRFSLSDLMDLLRDRRHEGWVLAAYPDPKTGRPLIGAGFSLDLPEREHPQTDPLNPHPFVEPSSAQLWQAAGLDPALLQQVLDQFDGHLAAWRTTRRYRHRIWTLDPEITDDQAEALLRISAVQAIVNARAWCRDFDQLTGPQQMAVSQLVYQMGVNLGEFSTFLALLNHHPTVAAVAADPGAAPAETSVADVDHWRDVQQSLIQSQWARLYRVRAVSVIAMLDPLYVDDPAASEARIAAVLHPAHHRRHRGRPALRAASYARRSGRTLARKSTRMRTRRKV